MARRRRSGDRALRAPIAVRSSKPATRAKTAEERGNARDAVLVAVLLILGITALYLATAARDIVFGDSPELTGVAVTLGVAHPPGYPLWTMLAHVFTLLPLGSLPFRVSLFSVAASVTCLGVVYAASYRLTRNVVASAAAVLALALSPVYWAWSLVPEVFPLNDALAAVLVYLLLLWHRSGERRLFVASAFVGGLGMANQQTIALVGIAVVVLLWSHARRFFRDPDLLVHSAAAFAVGLIPYLYLPIAAATHPPYDWGEIASIGDLLGHLLRVGYGSTQLVTTTQLAGGSALDRLVELALSFTPPEAILGVLGGVLLYRRDRVWLAFVAAAFALCGPAFVLYSNIDVTHYDFDREVLERFFLLAHVVLAPLAALGIVEIGHLGSRLRQVRRELLEAGTAVAAIVVTVAVGAANFGDLDRHDDHVARHFAEDILASVRPNDILLAGGDPIVQPLEYLTKVEGARRDVTVIDVPLLGGQWYLRQIQQTHPTIVPPRSPIPPDVIRGFIEANHPERIDVLATLPDSSLTTTYGFYRHGLVQEIRRNEDVFDVGELAALNDKLLRSYRIPAVTPGSRRRWERLILTDYALPAYDVGRVFDLANDHAKAREWYVRALRIDPDLTEARQALGRATP